MLSNKYSGKNILVLDDIEAIRKNPGMYIGELENPNHLFYEVINNSIDEHIMGFGSHIKVKFIEESVVEVEDNGRGIPFDNYNEQYLACEIIFLKNHSGGKFKTDVYKRSGGLHGIGLVAVNALSEWLEVSIVRENIIHCLKFEHGKLTKSYQIDNYTEKTNGTTIRFCADSLIFKDTKFNIETIISRLSYISALNPSLVMDIDMKFINRENVVLHSPDGVKTLMDSLIKENSILPKNIIFHYSDDEYDYEIVLNWGTDISSERYIAFTNCIIQPDGGTHVYGVRSAIVEFFNTNKIFANILNNRDVVYNDIKSGIVFIVNLNMQSPSFSSQEKIKLVSNAVKGHILSHFSQFLTKLYEENPELMHPIIKKISKHLLNKYQKDHELNLSAMLLNGALFDCYTKDREEAELFIAEGESAAGIVKPVMDRKTQAILAIRGKILNVEKANLGQILESDKLYSIIKAIGGSLGQDNKIIFSNLRYGKIIILADADVDGDHIRTLVLTLFHKYAVNLINENRIFIAVPPLYKLQISSYSQYFNTDDDLMEFFISNIKDASGSLVKIPENMKPILITWFKVLYNKYWSLNIDVYVAFVIDFMINNYISSYDEFVKSINNLSEKIKLLSSTIEVFINNKNEIVVENYTSLHKQIFSKEMIEILIKNITKDIDSIIHKKLNDVLKCGENIVQFLFKYLNNIQNKVVIQRFKGLGEMNKDQIYETVINKKKRILKLVQIEDIDKCSSIRNMLMGNLVKNRKNFIIDYLTKNLNR